MNKIYCFFIVCFLLFVLMQLSAEENLIINPGLEEGSESIPDNWRIWSWNVGPEFTKAVWINDSNLSHSGKRCISIENIQDNDARLVQKVIVKEGDKVNQGDIVAKIGNTGLSFGAHLHFTLREPGKVATVDPEKYIGKPLI